MCHVLGLSEPARKLRGRTMRATLGDDHPSLWARSVGAGVGHLSADAKFVVLCPRCALGVPRRRNSLTRTSQRVSGRRATLRHSSGLATRLEGRIDVSSPLTGQHAARARPNRPIRSRLPDLPYAYDALEPHIDQKTLQLHHRKHHATYVKQAQRSAREGHPDLHELTLAELLRDVAKLPEHDAHRRARTMAAAISTTIFFWNVMAPAPRASRAARSAMRSKRSSAPSQISARNSPTPPAKHFASGWVALVARSRHAQARDRGAQGSRGRSRRRASRAADPRRLGARVLPEVPEPPPRIHRGVLERRRIGRTPRNFSSTRALAERNRAGGQGC